MAIAAAILAAGLVAGCGSASKRLPPATLDRLVAGQAATYVREPAFVPLMETEARATEVEMGRVSSSGDMTFLRRAAKSVAAVPLSEYACSATSQVRGSSATFRCTIGSFPPPAQVVRLPVSEGLATATCDVSTGQCGAWHATILSLAFGSESTGSVPSAGA